MNVSRNEMETTVTYVRSEKEARLYTCDPVVVRKLDKLCQDYPQEYRCVKREQDIGAAFYVFPFKRLRFGHASNAATFGRPFPKLKAEAEE